MIMARLSENPENDRPLGVLVENHVHEIRNALGPPTMRADRLLGRLDRGATVSEEEYVDALRRLKAALARAHKSIDVLADALDRAPVEENQP